MSKWVDPQGNATGDFPTQGSVAVFRAVGRQSSITVNWWSRPFLFGMISGTLVIVGLILRRTSWDNRITVVLVALFAWHGGWSLQGDNASSQYIAMAWPGALVVGGIWLTGLLIGSKNAGTGLRLRPRLQFRRPRRLRWLLRLWMLPRHRLSRKKAQRRIREVSDEGFEI